MAKTKLITTKATTRFVLEKWEAKVLLDVNYTTKDFEIIPAHWRNNFKFPRWWDQNKRTQIGELISEATKLGLKEVK